MEKMGTSRLEAIVSLYCLNGFDGYGIFHNGITSFLLDPKLAQGGRSSD